MSSVTVIAAMAEHIFGIQRIYERYGIDLLQIRLDSLIHGRHLRAPPTDITGFVNLNESSWIFDQRRKGIEWNLCRTRVGNIETIKTCFARAYGPTI